MGWIAVVVVVVVCVCVCVGGMLKSGSQQITEPYRAAPSYHDLGQQNFFPILLVSLDLRGFFFSPFFFSFFVLVVPKYLFILVPITLYIPCSPDILVHYFSYYFIIFRQLRLGPRMSEENERT